MLPQDNEFRFSITQQFEQERRLRYSERRRYRVLTAMLAVTYISLFVSACALAWSGRGGTGGDSYQWLRLSVLTMGTAILAALSTVYLRTIRVLARSKMVFRLGEDKFDVEIGEGAKHIKERLAEHLKHGGR